MDSSSVTVKNHMPYSILCEGNKYKSTEDLKPGELLLFIDRDISQFIKKYFDDDVSYSIRIAQGFPTKFQIDLFIKENVESLVQYEVEEILWSYNKQYIFQDDGRMQPAYPRFIYSIHCDLTPKSQKSIQSIA